MYKCGCFSVNPKDDPVMQLVTRLIISEVTSDELPAALEVLEKTRQPVEPAQGIDNLDGSTVSRKRYEEIVRQMREEA